MLINLMLFYVSGFMIFWAMIGYPIVIKILDKIINKENEKDYSLEPTVTIMIVAHNEEKVIKEKLDNVCKVNYPKNKIKIMVSSDNSTDETNDIVIKYKESNPTENIELYEVQERKGKTNAQNEAQKLVDTEFLVMTDANAMLEVNSIRELMASFVSDNIAYVTGCLKYINTDDSKVAESEASYWDDEIKIRNIESKIQTITAGNGALYACRNKDYYDIPNIECHDSSMPFDFAMKKRRAINNIDAIAYEKAGEVHDDEFKRKVRMNRIILLFLKKSMRTLNIFRFKWFSFFYFGHRTCRYLLWINHLVLLMSNGFLVNNNFLYKCIFVGQLLFYFIVLIQHYIQFRNKYIRLMYYYCLTIIAQWFGVLNGVLGKAKPVWEKAETTR